LNEKTIEQSVKDTVKLPHIQAPFVKEDPFCPCFSRQVDFDEAHNLNSQSFRLLYFLHQIRALFNLAYFMGKTNAPGVEVLENELHTFTGRNYWEKSKAVVMVRHDDNESVSERIINMIVAKKKARVDLAEDLKNVAIALQNI